MKNRAQQQHQIGYRGRTFFVNVLLAGSVLLTAACGNDGTAPPPSQPVAFNHQKHIEIEMECTRCHPGATTQTQAGLVPIAACATCHRGIISDHPEIVKLMGYLENNEPLLWRRVNSIAPGAMVQFRHKPHARAGVSCSTCHGDVGQMSVAYQAVNTADMSWCITCHQNNGASTDCLTCHY